MIRSGCCVVALAGGLLLLTVSPSRAQIDYPESRFKPFTDHLLTDYAYFRAEDSPLIRLELYYQIHHRGLSFSLSGEDLVAAYELVVRVEDNDNNLVESYTRDRQIVLAARDESRTRTDFRTSQIALEVPPGKYKAHFRLTDKAGGRTIAQELRIKLDRLYHDRPRLSAVEFAQVFERRSDPGSIFSKEDMLVVPSVHRVYGTLDSDRLAYYFEVYPGSDDLDKVIAETRIRHYRKGLLYRDTLHLALKDSTIRQLREVSMAEFLPGEYELEISLRGRRNKQLAKCSQEFSVAWTQDGMIRNDWKALVKQLELFSEDVDVGDMEKLKTHEERLWAFEQFWRERDPTDGTPENEAKTAFYHRIRVANERFGILRRDGWRTDRGQVYIRYGEPDYLVDEPFALDSRPYQIWHYTSLAPTRRFLFVDENEDGDYRLQYPYDGLSRTSGY